MRDVRADFPILTVPEDGKRLVYLDSAATTQRPLSVLAAMEDFSHRSNANPHRGVYELAQRATDAHEDARAAVARFLNAGPEEIVFTQNATEALNLAAYSYGMSFLKAGDEIAVYVAEHHSNLVPWQRVAQAVGATVVYLYPDEAGRLTKAEYEAKIGPKTKLTAVAQVSNVLGLETPIRDIAAWTHKFGGVLVADTAQSIPHMPVDVKALDVDFAVCSAHKLYGPMGVGCLYAKAELLEKMPPFLSGGDMIGVVHESGATWAEGPRKFEAGTRNVSGEVGFAAAIDYLGKLGWPDIIAHEDALLAQTLDGLAKLPYVTVYGSGAGRRGVVSFNIEGVHPHDAATILDADGVCIRAGHHCAQPLMDRLGIGFCCRASFAVYNTPQDVETFLRAIPNARRVMGLGA